MTSDAKLSSQLEAVLNRSVGANEEDTIGIMVSAGLLRQTIKLLKQSEAAPALYEALANMVVLARPFMTDDSQLLGMREALAALRQARGEGE